MLMRFAANAGLLVASLFLSLGLAELSLRLVFPKYTDAANTHYDRDNSRIWSPRPERRTLRRHRVTGVEHSIIYNDFALRQSRNFSNLDSTTNIAFFGDSYTVNLSLPVQYSFTEPLDYLLNSAESKFSVLNFGVNGYGTDQNYLNYLSFDGRGELNYVFYVLCANDLRNIYETGLFSVDAEGVLERNPVPRPRWWISVLARLHVTYLVLDVRQRLLHSRSADVEIYRHMFEATAMHSEHRTRFNTPQALELQHEFLNQQFNADAQRALVVFQSILDAWQRSVDAAGAQFAVVLLPTGREDLFIPFIPEGIEVISLFDLYSEVIPNFTYEKVRFKTGSHWNEKGNMFAATAIYKSLQPHLNLPAKNEAALQSELTNYYEAFGGWMPEAAGDSDRPINATSAQRIREKYLDLETVREPSERAK